MRKLKFKIASFAKYEALEVKDPETLYFVNEEGSFANESVETTGVLYLGEKQISAVPNVSVDRYSLDSDISLTEERVATLFSRSIKIPANSEVYVRVCFRIEMSSSSDTNMAYLMIRANGVQVASTSNYIPSFGYAETTLSLSTFFTEETTIDIGAMMTAPGVAAATTKNGTYPGASELIVKTYSYNK